MKTKNASKLWRLGLALALICTWSIPQLAGAGNPPAIPTGPLVNGHPATPDYYTTANWANSPPLAKFVDTLPGLGSGKFNNLGQYLSVGKPDITTYPGSDYYEIDLVQYKEQMHSDLPKAGTLLRGYVQVNRGTNISAGTLPSQNKCGNDQHACTAADTVFGVGVTPDAVHYLGPNIIAERDRPVRIKFTNKLPAGTDGDLFIPVDTSVMGAGPGPARLGAGRGLGSPCDNTVDNNSCASYTQNRAVIHMHGGRTPWISDGTPHQWITPADEITPFSKGVSFQNVPDMPDPGDGSMTYYYTNQQSARLMFYHDHAFGITRLNVYAGEAAAYIITDQYEQDLINRGIIPADQIPLVLQDKTYVNAAEIRKYDPLWNWGSSPLVNGVRDPVDGDLWLPHVYMPAQSSIAGAGGVNPFGRWMYGPWFYPATIVTKGPVANPYYDADCSSPFKAVYANCKTPGQPTKIPGTPNTSMGMEAFQDSAVVNGTAFPSLTVDPRAYRFRILNAASDRFWNLSFYQADTTDPLNVSPDPRLLAPDRSKYTEVKMLPAGPTNGWPALWPTDGRAGGVPDPALIGPKFLQIGTEGGFLPKPVLIDQQPITYITDPTAFWVGNVDKMGLALGPAERADVIVDFSNFAGKTLILYNDAPAAWPAGVGNYDYYTGTSDARDTGGFGAGGVIDPATGAWITDPANPLNIPHGTMPGYAPNTRTVMQVIVRGAGSTVDGPSSYTKTNLEKEFTADAPIIVGVTKTSAITGKAQTLFERSQDPIIVGQAAYSTVYPDSYFPPNFPWEGIAQINDQSLQFVTLAGDPLVITTEPKGLHDEMGASFDPIYGRMSGNLAMQIPNPTTLTANLILYGFSDVPTENVNNSTQVNISVIPDAVTGYNKLAPGDGTQIWKISHNGVDTHPIHFHIFDVQLINRVGWDGQILMPEPNELGWKDTVKISPLEDTIVAVRPRAPALPFGITKSLRPLNPAIPIDSPMGFSSIDPVTGQAYVAPSIYAGGVTNVLFDFGWEYVWHCHILSHEEMDMMRPIVLNVLNTTPNAPTQTTSTTFTGNVDVTWVDPTPVANPATMGNIQNEIGFIVQRCAGETCTDFSTIGSTLANATSFTDTTATITSDPYFRYQVFAYNVAGDSPISNIVKAMTTDPISGVCGASDGGTYLTKPTIDLCSVGTSTAVTGTGPWGWSCAGFNAGATLTCAAAIQQYSLIFNHGANGTLGGSTAQLVNYSANSTTVTALPNIGYHFVNWTEGATVITTNAALSITNVTAAHMYTANFAIDTFTINYAAAAHGTLTGVTSQTINYGSNTTTVTAVANLPGYHFLNWKEGAIVVGITPALTINNVTATHSYTANFAVDTFAVTFAAAANGTLTGNKNQSVNYGGNSTAVTEVPNTGYHLVNWTGTGGFVTSTANPLTVSNVTAAQTITANFAINTYSVNFIAGTNGTLTGTASQTITHGASATQVTAVANLPGYHFVNWTGTGGFVTTTTNPLTVTNVTAAQTITANFAIDTFAVNFIAGANGTLTGTASQLVNYTANATTVTAVPSLGYQFVSWTNSLGAIVSLVPSLSITNVTAAATYTANFYVPKDFNTDGNVDILWTDTTTNNSIVWYMNNVTKLSEAALPASPGAGYTIVATGDFNNDGKTDIIYRNQTTGANVLYYMNGAVKLSEVALATLGGTWTIVGTGDFNSDGKLDILWRNTATGANSVWVMDGATRTSIIALPVLAGTAQIVGTGDFNNDGKVDLLWRDQATGINSVWLMNGTTRSSIVTLTALGGTWQIVGTGDFNKDGKVDILWRNPATGANSVWVMNGTTRTSIATAPALTGTNWTIVGK